MLLFVSPHLYYPVHNKYVNEEHFGEVHIVYFQDNIYVYSICFLGLNLPTFPHSQTKDFINRWVLCLSEQSGWLVPEGASFSWGKCKWNFKDENMYLILHGNEVSL